MDWAAIQKRLNELGANPPLAEDGILGPMTRAAVISFQSANNLTADGVVGPETLAALGLSDNPAIVTQPTQGKQATMVAVPGIEKLSPSEIRALYDVATYLGIQADWLAAAMSFESRLNPAAVNSMSGATGLIQFMPSTARNLGTTTEALKGMTFTQQLEYVKRYFEAHKGQMHNLQDVYLVIFYPAEVGKAPSDVIASAGNPVYDQNAVFDRTGKGYITREDVTSTITNLLDQAIATGKRVAIPGIMAAGIGIGAILLMAASAFAAWKFGFLKGVFPA